MTLAKTKVTLVFSGPHPNRTRSDIFSWLSEWAGVVFIDNKSLGKFVGETCEYSKMEPGAKLQFLFLCHPRKTLS